MPIDGKVLEDLRRRLLDIGKRNRLINFRFSERSRNHLRIVDELPDVIHSRLIEEKPLYFAPLSEPEDEPEDEHTDIFLMALEAARSTDKEYLQAMAKLDEDDDTSAAGLRIERQLKDRVRSQLSMPERPSRDTLTPAQIAVNMGLDPSYDLPAPKRNNKQNKAHLDDKLQTLLFPDQLERKLSGINDGARIAFSEMGVNVLFVAIGYLEWYESDDSDQKLFAPLLLHPLAIQRSIKRQKYEYSIKTYGEDTESNHTLKERMQLDFGLVFPPFEMESDTPERYFQSIAKIIEDQKRWKVRRFVTVGLFPFSKIAMYHDLDPKNWPGSTGLLEHSVLSDLLSISMMGDSLHPEDHDIDALECDSQSPLLIADADSSQHATVADVLKGKNLAVKGPPGTGKSQTITNVIAAAMARGMKVLFIAEKMAALDVVKNRLDHAGIGIYSLELHSTKANKKNVLQSLRERLDLAQKRPVHSHAFKTSLAELETLRRELKAYVELLNQPFGNSGEKLHEIIWGAIKFQQQSKEVGLNSAAYDVFFEHTSGWGAPDIENRRLAVLSLQAKCEEIESQFGQINDCPFWGIRCPDLTLFEEEQLREILRSLHRTVDTLKEKLVSLANKLASPIEPSVTMMEKVGTAVDLAIRSSDIKDVLSRTTAEKAEGILGNCIERLERISRIEDGLLVNFDVEGMESIPSLDELKSLEEASARKPRGCPITDGSIQVFESSASEYHGAANRLEGQIEKLSRKLDTLSTGLPITDRLLHSFLNAKKILDEIDRDTLLHRTEALFSEKVRPELKRAAETCAQLKAEQERLSQTFRFSLEEDSQVYRDSARTLRAASFLERVFGKKYRAAKKLWSGSSIVDAKKDPRAIASVFDEVAAHLENVQKFTNDASIAASCGAHFQGLETNFFRLLRVNKFALYVCQAFPGSDEHIRVVREFLLSAEIGELDRFKSLLDEEETKTARYLVQACRKFSSGSGPVELGDVPAAYKSIANWCGEMRESLARLRFKPAICSSELPGIIKGVEELKGCKGSLQEHALVALLGCSPLEFLGKVDQLRRIKETHQELVSLDLPSGILAGILRKETSVEVLREVLEESELARKLLVDLATAIDTSLPKANVDAGEFFSRSRDFNELNQNLRRIVDFIETLPVWTAFCTIEKRCQELSLAPLLDWYTRSGAPGGHLRVAFEVAFSRSLMQDAYKTHPQLKRFTGTTQEEARSRFLATDRKIIQLMQQEVQAVLARNAIPMGVNAGPKKGWTDLALIQNEIGKKQKHIPIRDLFRRAGDAIQQMKPCWLMSPASVAQFLSPGDVQFDIVIIDEASQMLPEDAVGAIARSKQAVIVGDPMQLPPTNFFNKIDSSPQDDEDYEEYVDSESVLDRALSAFHPSRTLHWHYRSRHDSLIAFSNKHFYNGDLVLFPSREHQARVELVKVDGIYTPGKRVNFKEIQAVADSVITFMRDHPKLSLGVVTMNQSQREILLDEIDRLFTRNPSAEKYLSRWENSLEPFFVKNLENVQGDERDVIFISTVYGPQEPGGKVAQRFGPINGEGGHRRLNVLFTRAKEKIVLFSSMTSADILVSDGKKQGVAILKEYLEYAETGRLSIGSPTGRAPDSDFEIHVANRLRQLGYEVDAQVGSAGYFIDLAVREPGKTNRYIVGIECDGANYHSAKSTRDRDRLRQEILESLGWRIYRIWSTDWFTNPDWEMQKLEKYIAQCKTLN